MDVLLDRIVKKATSWPRLRVIGGKWVTGERYPAFKFQSTPEIQSDVCVVVVVVVAEEAGGAVSITSLAPQALEKVIN